MSVAKLIEAVDATLEVGNPEVLYGFPEFDAGRVQRDLSEYMIGAYPTLTQCVVARVGCATRPAEHGTIDGARDGG